MKVLQINSVCGYGSTGRIATDLYNILEKNGHECCIAYGRGSAPKGYNTIKIGNKFDFYSHVLKTRLFDLHGFGSKRATRKLIEQIKEYKPDIIHLHNLHGYYLNIEVLFNYLATIDIPIIWLLHDAWSMSGHSAHFDLDSDDNIPKNNTKKFQKFEYPKSYVFDNSKKNFLKKKKLFTQVKDLTIIVPSNWLAEIVKKSFLSLYDVKVIHNGIDLSKFKITPSNFKKDNGLANEKIILGVASVWNDKKGLNYFNKLAQNLDDKFKIVLVGINKKQMKKLDKNILAISRTENIKKLAEIYTSADVFVNPTIEDNFPTTILESLACGTPVITFDTGGSAESLDENVGTIIEKENFNKLIKAIENFDYEYDYLNSCLKRAQVFDRDKVYDKYNSYYNQLILKSKFIS
ncbi:glycosyltransferase [Carnobacterium antarcticum]|uniref:Glycosyltransferase n=1 Tax=Carnobacterium antarcticum TaxID=2126436 RepID=A0ABW4NJ59_9LACT|nr:glycosyltransferase [Carnobacterium sp. CP1]ALV21539.1 Glycosyltransferase [Carnobacterium sp. CP1]